MIFFNAFIFGTFFLSSLAEDIRLLDLEPTDAQQYIDKQDQTLKYAPKIESNVPAVRYLGNEPHNVLEDIYLANQYHGQDGLGSYLYGYSVPDIAKTEKKKAGGDLRGAYNYIAGNGQEIKVEYWDDGTGFHQIDNVPKVLPKQIEDTPEVKAAREEHFRIWQEQAERNSKPVQSPYNSQGQYAQGPLSAQGQQQQYQAQYQQQGQAQQLVNQYQQQKQQYPNPGQAVQYHGEQGQQTQQINRYQQASGGFSSPQGTGQYSGGAGGQVSGQFGQGGYRAGAQSSAGFQGQGGQASGSYQVSGQYSGGQQGSGQGGGLSSGGLGGGLSSSGLHSGVQGGAQYSGSQGGQYAGGQGGGLSSGGLGGGLSSGGLRSGVQGGGQYSAGQQSGGQYSGGQGGQYGGGYQSGSQSGGHGSGDEGQWKEEQGEGQWKEEQGEEQGPPRGFFYSFDYPVGIIVQKDGGAAHKRDVKEVYAENKANFEQQLQGGQLQARPGRSATGYLFIKE